ncbi:MAG: GNAT family N-acetyltransferase [Rhizobiaceae bacterium]|nr:GNAT family N-acetyltransferase [Rhizobiaceae bacterium]
MTAVAKSDDGRLVVEGRLVIERHDRAVPVEREWRHLEMTGAGTLFQRFDWIDSWLQTAGREDAVAPAILLGRLDERPAFVLPLGIRRVGPVSMAEFLGAGHSGYNFGLWSLEGAAFVQALPRDALVGRLRAALGADALVLRRVPPQVAGVAQPLAILPARPSEMSGYSVSLEGGMEAVLARTGGGARRRRANQKERRMREMGPVECGPAADLDEAFAALGFFAEQKALRLAEQGLQNPFAEPGVMDFLQELLRRSQGSTEPLLEMQRLSLSGDMRAVIGTGLHRGRVALQILTYIRDETLPHSPGQVLLYRDIEAGAAAARSVYDFGIGQEGYKDSWADTVISLNDHFAAFTPAGHLALASMRLGSGLRVALRENRLAGGLVRAWRRREQETEA